jgi:predicted metal-binding membrane protein
MASQPAALPAPETAGAAPRGRAAGADDRVFLAASTLLFIAGAAGAILWCGSMGGGMPMPGGWTMSMAWMRMPGQGWFGAATSFMTMWVVMMVAMMVPSLVPMLQGYRRTLRAAGEARVGARTAIAGASYFLVWAAFGAVAYALGVALASAEMRSPALARAVPAATGAALLLAGCLQLSPWKIRRLDGCRNSPACCGPFSPGLMAAVRAGRRLGLQCALCCSGLMAVLLVGGVMDLGVMAAVTVGITLERVVPRALLAARATGLVVVTAGIAMLGRALLRF